MSRKVAIVGFADTYKSAPFDDPSVEIWGINELHRYLPRWDRWFELHARENFEIKGNRDQEQHVRWLQTYHQHSPGKPLYMRERFEDIPAGEVYPLAAMARLFFESRGRAPYFTSTIGYMLALALAEGRDAQLQPDGSGRHVEWIGLYGIDLAADSEYAEQRPNAEYFVGLAEGLGIQVVIPNSAALMRGDHLYGFERRGDREGVISTAFLDKRIAELTEKRNKCFDTLHCLDGALEEALYHRKLIEHHRRGVPIEQRAS